MVVTLDDFDFDRVDDSLDFENHSALSPLDMALLDRLQQAATDNDISAVEDIFETIRGTDAESAIIAKAGWAVANAVDKQHEDIVRFLLSRGVPVSQIHAKSAVKSGSKPMIQLVLDHGWSINEQLAWSDPPMLAYATDDIELTKWLLARGADPNASCRLNMTPLGAALRYSPMEVVELLFAHGGSVKEGQLLHSAIGRKQPDRVEAVKYVLQKGADVNAMMYCDHPASYYHCEAFGIGTPLHSAAEAGDLDVTQVLLDAGADINAKNTKGQLPYEEAQYEGHIMAAKLLHP